MALQTKTFTAGGTSSTRNYSIKLKLTEESTSVASNTSVVSYEFSIHRQNYGIFTGPYFNWNIEICGNIISIRNFAFNLPTSGASSQVIASGKLTINHDSDGGKEMSFDVYTPSAQELSPTYGPPEIRIADSWTLMTIPRASSVSAINADIGSDTLITISRASSAFTHTITYEFGSLSGTIASKTNKTSIPWTIPESFYGQIPNSKYGTVTLTCKTYSGNTLLGSKTTTFRAIADEDESRPTVSGSAVSTDAKTAQLTGSADKIIRYISTVRTTISATAKNSSKITRKTVNGVALDSTKDFTAVETGKFVFSADDSRGYTGSKTVNLEIVQYARLTITPSVRRLTPTGDTVALSIKGSFWNGDFGAESNALTISYQYQKDGGSWSAETPITGASISGGAYSAYVEVSGIDYQEPYVFRFVAQDKSMKQTHDVPISRGLPVFAWGKDWFGFNVPVELPFLTVNSESWSGISFYANGEKVSGFTTDPGSHRMNLLQYPPGEETYSYRYLLPTPVDNLTADKYYLLLTTQDVGDYVVAQGVSGNWRWRKWNSGVAECWQRYSYETPEMVAVGGIFYSPEDVGGLAYPFEFLAKPTELVSCDGNVGGWYAAANDLPTNTTKETGYYHFFGARPRPAGYIAMNIHEIGRWK